MADKPPHGSRGCCAIKCTNSRKNSRDLSFHSFPHKPEDLERCKKWVHNLKRRYVVPELLLSLKQDETQRHIIGTRNLLLCEEHFTADQFMNPADKGKPIKRKHLRQDAIPTVFDLPNIVQSVASSVVKRESPRKIKAPGDALLPRKRLKYLLPSDSEMDYLDWSQTTVQNVSEVKIEPNDTHADPAPVTMPLEIIKFKEERDYLDWNQTTVRNVSEVKIEPNDTNADPAPVTMPLEIIKFKEEMEDSPSSVCNFYDDSSNQVNHEERDKDLLDLSKTSIKEEPRVEIEQNYAKIASTLDWVSLEINTMNLLHNQSATNCATDLLTWRRTTIKTEPGVGIEQNCTVTASSPKLSFEMKIIKEENVDSPTGVIDYCDGNTQEFEHKDVVDKGIH
ncbi:THAP domain-containing protein 5 [Nymphon striatum]|nr:THAP domain-containing protein 5 [Nymphon striatum]